MNEFVAKKLGEVHALSNIGIECFERSKDGFSDVMEAADAQEFVTKLSEFRSVAGAKGSDVTVGKSEKTTVKLRGMMEAYIGDEWDNPVEILEWLSFFLGSASAHWSLVSGAASGIADNELKATATDASAYYKAKLEYVIQKLNSVGEQKASN